MAVTQTELKSSFLKNILEEEEYQSNVKALQDWLTGATQAATQQYQATAQTAAEQASYDISGAYANYLKQQRAVTAQGQLESGHKEEIGDVLQQQFQGAYSQARTAQAQTVAKAQEQYSKSVAGFEETATKSAQAYYDAAIKEAEQRAKLYKAAEEYAEFSDDSQFALYNVTDGRYNLTDYGLDKMSAALLDEKGGFKQYLEDAGMSDILEYYLSDVQGLHESLFGITDTKYDKSSSESYARRLGAVSTEGVSYIDTLDKPTIDLNVTDFALGFMDFGKTGHAKFVEASGDIIKYAKDSLGLTDDEIKKAFGYANDKASSSEQVAKFVLAEAAHKLKKTPIDERDPKAEFNSVIKMLDDYAKSKYIKE